MLVYLDNSATTQPSPGVVGEVTRALEEEFYNPSSLYAPALTVEKELRACREKLLRALKAPDATVIFTSGGTEANDLALWGTVGVSRPPVRIAVSAGEHPSVYEAAKALESDGCCETVILPLTGEGTVDLDALEKELKKGLTLLSCMQVNNETGAINDIKKIGEMTKHLCPTCVLHVDGVQGFLREEMDLHFADLYTVSAHKLHAPKGTGALIVKKGLRLKPRHVGGGQEKGLRSGTENTPGIIGFSRALDEMMGMPTRQKRMMELKLQLLTLLQQAVPGCLVNGPAPEKGACHILNVSFPGVRSETMLHALEQKGVLVGNGSACSSHKKGASRVLTEMGIDAKRADSAIRFSLCPYTSESDIQAAARALQEAYEILVKFQRR
ncbi:MAG: cysteine desulfurase [Clostridia bacterium]|nr:cysteine desulfurase [Clostridia bacterium]